MNNIIELREVFELEEDYENFVLILKEVSKGFLLVQNTENMRKSLEWNVKDLISRYLMGGKLKFNIKPIVVNRYYGGESVDIVFVKEEDK